MIVLEVAMETAPFVFTLIGIFIAGLAIGFVVTRTLIQKQLKQNPPINEKMIRVMFKQMGRTPSEAQIRQVMNAMNQQR